jgi:hypothetical protein
MKSFTTSRFRACLDKLPGHIQVRAHKSYRLWLENPFHPSFQFKQIHSISPKYAVRVSLGYRALGILEDDSMEEF